MNLRVRAIPNQMLMLSGNFLCRKNPVGASVLVLVLLLAQSLASFGQTSFTGSYTQNFNSLATSGTSTTLPSGWALSEAGGNTSYTASDGSGTTGDTYSYGTGTNSDRALGELTSGTVTSTFGVRFTNNTGSTITALTISYTGEQWRKGGTTNTDVLSFSYNPTNGITTVTSGTWTSVSSLDFNSVVTTSGATALDGNNANNRTTITGSISGLSIANGATFWIRWQGSNINGSDDGLAVDDLTVTNCTSFTQPTITVSETSAGSNNDGTICSGASATLDAGGGYSTYSWTPGGATTQSINVSPGSTTTYTVTVTSGSCQGTDEQTITVLSIPATPGAITGSTSVCPNIAGFVYSISSVSGATGYTWSVPTGWSITSGQGSTSVTVTSGAVGEDGNISVTADNACGSSSPTTLALSIVNYNDIGFNGNTATNTLSICAGTTGTTLNGGNPPGGETFTWQVSTTSASGPFSTVSPNPGDSQNWTISSTYYNNPGTYYFRRVITSNSVCNGNSDVVTLTVNANPTPSIAVTENSGTANDGIVCNGTQVTLDAGAFSAYVWAPGGATTQSIMVTPGATTTYTVTVTNAASCTASATQVITVNNLPTINSLTASPATICAGQSSTLAVSLPNNGTQTFTSSGGSVTINDNANASPFPKTIMVSGLPSSGITVAKVTLTGLTEDEPQDMDIYLSGPNGQSIWLTSDAGGGGTITSFTLNFADGGTAISTSAFINGGTYDPGNLGSGDATPPGTLISALSSFSGNQNGTWSLYIIDDSSTGAGGSMTSWSISFDVPNYTYAWSNGPVTTSSQTVSPVSTTNYTVTVTDAGTGCSATASVTVTVNTPACSISGPDPVCANSTGHVYTATGGGTYEWDIMGNGTINGSNTNSTVTVDAGTAGTYTVTVTVTNAGCTSSCSKTVTVNALPNAGIAGNLSFCSGSSTTLTASGGVSYAWSNGDNTAMTNISTAGTYTVVVTDGNGCTSSAEAMVTENLAPTASIMGTLSFCTGGSTTLTASGGGSYAWSNGDNTAMTNISTAGTYTVVVTAANGCTDSAEATVTENLAPTASIMGTLSFCTGGSTTLTASGGGSYAWSNGDNTAMTNISTAGTYTVVVTAANGCTDSAEATVTENPAATADAGGPYATCGINPVAINAMANGPGTWSGGLGGFGDATSAGTYYQPDAAEVGSTVVLTWTTDDPDGGGPCISANSNANLDVNTPASANAGGPYTTCGTSAVAISATVSGPGSWSGGMGVFANASNPSTTYTPDMSELGTAVLLTWTTFDPDGAGPCMTASDMATVMVSGQEIDVRGGNGTGIANGDLMPSVSDESDFGWTMVSSGTITRTFVIENTGSSPLTLTGVTPVTLSGTNMADFVVTQQPVSPVGPGSSTTFEIQFDPSAAGLRSATVNIANDDCDEAPYTFGIQGTGTIPQAISVFGNGNQISNRASSVSVSDDTDFGSASTGGGMVTHTFTIYNITNGAPLKLDGIPTITIADRDASDFSVMMQPTTPLGGGDNSTFSIKFQPTAAGLRTAIVIITHNDLPENPFVFTINGTGL